MKSKLLTVAMTVAVASVAVQADAAITVYTSQSAYLTAVSNPGTDTFESLGTAGLTPSPINRTAGSYGYTASADGGFYGVGSSGDHWLSTNDAPDNIVLNSFTGGVFGVGGLFFGTDIDGNPAPAPGITLSATDASGTVTRIIANPTSNSFLGFVSTSGILSFTVISPSNTSNSGPFYFPTVNNLVLGGSTGSVPEPSTWAMMIAGFALVGGSLRRRRLSVTFAA